MGAEQAMISWIDIVITGGTLLLMFLGILQIIGWIAHAAVRKPKHMRQNLRCALNALWYTRQWEVGHIFEDLPDHDMFLHDVHRRNPALDDTTVHIYYKGRCWDLCMSPEDALDLKQYLNDCAELQDRQRPKIIKEKQL
jgi:hypothetical protein